jgi:hypothetical protein
VEGGKGMRYIKLREHGPESKKPVEQWRKEENQYGLDELRGWILSGHNVGFVCGSDDICVLDIDAPARVDELGVKPFETFAVRTGSGGYHLYYKVIGPYKKVIIHDFEGTHLGELQANGQYVVAEGSIHPNGKRYQAVNPETPILEITQEELLLPFRGRCKLSDEDKPVYKFREFKGGSKEDELGELRVEDIWEAKVTEEGNSQLFCIHPIHGSSTKTNLVINPSKNTWWCGRHQSGGGVALAIAVRYGLIDCADARPGALRGEKYKKVLEIAREKGLIKDPQQMIIKKPRRFEIDE